MWVHLPIHAVLCHHNRTLQRESMEQFILVKTFKSNLINQMNTVFLCILFSFQSPQKCGVFRSQHNHHIINKKIKLFCTELSIIKQTPSLLHSQLWHCSICRVQFGIKHSVLVMVTILHFSFHLCSCDIVYGPMNVSDN
jgi:hypothetical protein